MKNSVEHSLEVVNEIMTSVISSFEVKGDVNQLKTGMMPLISNAMFNRDKEVLEQERFETLITLSRTLDDEQVKKVIRALRYSLTVK